MLVIGAPLSALRSAVANQSSLGALFNFDWITLVVMILLLLIGGIYFLLARPDRRLSGLGTAPLTEPAGSPAADR